jgi:GAF domain-containing protein
VRAPRPPQVADRLRSGLARKALTNFVSSRVRERADRKAVNSTLDLETVLATIVAKAVQLSNTDAGVIYVFDELDQTFRVRATYGLSEELIATIQDQQLGASDAIRQATQDGQPKEMPDTRDEPPSLVREIAMRAGFRGRLVVPLCASAAGCERVWVSGASFFNLAQ